ncbi:RDD family protein (modular protein) [Flavobacterium sp. 9AF]|nr:RDD family protein (modular protein) [Flavobacterium sp. 9AF]
MFYFHFLNLIKFNIKNLIFKLKYVKKLTFFYIFDSLTIKTITMEVSKLNRFLGIFIDGIVAYIIPGILAFVAGATEMYWLITLSYVLLIAYYLLRDALFGGQSIGKKVMKYKAVKEDGTSLSGDYVTSIMRNITLLIPLVDAILVLIDKPRLGDNIAKTKVVNA